MRAIFVVEIEHSSEKELKYAVGKLRGAALNTSSFRPSALEGIRVKSPSPQYYKGDEECQTETR